MEREYRFTLTGPLYRQVLRHAGQRYVTVSGLRPLVIALYLLFLAACFSVAVHSDAAASFGSGLLWSITAMFVLACLYLMAAQFSALRGVLRSNEAIGQEQYLRISEDGVRTMRTGSETMLAWSAVRAVESAKGQVLLYLDSSGVLAVPDQAFATPEDRSGFLAEVNARIGAAGAGEVRPAPPHADMAPAAAEPSADGTPNFWIDLQDNLRAGLRLAAFLRVSASDLSATWPQLAALTGSQLVIMLFCDLCAAQFRGGPNIFGLPGALFGIALSWIAAWALALLSGRSERTLVFLVAFAALAVPLELVFQFFAHALWNVLPPYRGFASSLIYFLPHYWFALAMGVAAARLLPMPTLRRFAAIVLAMLVWGIPSANIYRDADLWRAPYDEEQQAAFQQKMVSPAQEDIFYLQPTLLDRDLAEVKPGRKGVIDLYFIGAAGWATQDVFMKEVNSVGKLFEERFDATGRTIRLINNPKSAADTPIASVTALRRALQRVAAVMDADEDILFLFLTSHGSEQHRFSLQFWPMNFHELTPAKLKELLDESGIKRRVLIVSACYSGGFIDPLKDENSLIITASAPNRNSFGCSNEADFTYFGKAYFDEALRETYSFTEAFEIAKPRIALREKQANFTPSDPRIFIGDAIRAPLADVARILSEARPTAVAEMTSVSDRYTELADLWVFPEIFKEYREQCLRNMAKASPTQYVAKDPNYYGGLNKGSVHWPRLMTAWAIYSDEYCTAANDPRLYRRLYEKSWREILDAKATDAALRFFRTADGQRFVKSESTASVRVSAAAMDESTPATDRAMKRFQEEQTRVNADFQRERQGTKR